MGSIGFVLADVWPNVYRAATVLSGKSCFLVAEEFDRRKWDHTSDLHMSRRALDARVSGVKSESAVSKAGLDVSNRGDALVTGPADAGSLRQRI